MSIFPQLNSLKTKYQKKYKIFATIDYMEYRIFGTYIWNIQYLVHTLFASYNIWNKILGKQNIWNIYFLIQNILNIKYLKYTIFEI